MTALWLLSALAPVTTVVGLGLAGLLPEKPAGVIRTWLCRLGPLAIAPSVLLALAGPGAGRVEVPWLLVGTTTLEVDELGRPLLLVAALLYLAATIAVAYSPTQRGPALTAFLLVCFTGNTGVFIAADTVTFYLSFAVMSFAAYGLVVHEATADARRAGRIYLMLTVASEVCILAAMMLVVDAGGLMLADAPAAVAASPATNTIVLLLLLGFGVKAGTIPLHVWLPLAHPAAPPPASAVLSGTMIKAGLVGWLRFLPLGEAALVEWGILLAVLGLLGAFLAVPAGVLQTDAKVALAYSSISQMGFHMVLVGVALASPDLAGASVVAVTLYAVHHGIAKGALFLGVPMWGAHGAGPARWWIIIGLGGAALAVAGAPFSSGAVAKYAAKNALEGVTLGGLDLTALLPFVATASTVLLARFGWLLVTRTPPKRRAISVPLLSWAALVAGGIVLTWTLAGAWIPVQTVPGLEAVTVWEAAWPVLLGILLTAGGVWLSRRDLLPAWAAHPTGRTPPPGDLIVLEETWARRFTRAISGADAAWTRAWDVGRERTGRLVSALPSPPMLISRLEGRLEPWTASGVAVLLLIVLVALVGVW